MSVGYGGRAGTELVVVLDCADLDRAATFWSQVLGYVRPGAWSATYASLLPPDGNGIELLLQRVPELKQVKNRVHLDLRVRDLDAEVARLRALGARLATSAPIEEDGWTWYVLLDPDDNEFCVLCPPPSHVDQ